jgi:hypothetical protein
LTETDLEPWTSSGRAWRWRDRTYDVLPDDVLRLIRAVRRDTAQQYFQESLVVDRWIRDRPTREIDIDAHDEDSVPEWLRECAMDGAMVIASWSDAEALYLPWTVFTKYWSSFCYPSSDDVTVWSLDEQSGVSFTHSGTFYWRAEQ